MAQTYGPHIERLRAIAATTKDRLIAIGGERDAAGVSNSHVHVLSWPKGDAVFSAAVDSAVFALVLPAPELLVAGTAKGELLLWNHATKATEPVFKLAAHDGPVRALAAVDSTLASVGDDGYLHILALASDGDGPRLQSVARRQLTGRALHAVAIDPAATTVAAAGADNIIRALPLDGTPDTSPREMPCGKKGLHSLVFTGDGRIVAGCGDGSIQVCFLEGAVDEENRSGDAAHDGSVNALLFGLTLRDQNDRELPRRLFSVGADGQLKAWRLDERRKPRVVNIGSAPVQALALLAPASKTRPAQRGGTLVAVGRDRRLWSCAIDQDGNPAAKGETRDSRLAQLSAGLNAYNYKVRETAIKALAELAEDEARQALEQALAGDKNPPLRTLAARLLGESGRRLSRPALRRALDDEHSAARKAAFNALVKLEPDTPLAPLQAALHSQHEDLRLTAVQRLPELRTVSPLAPRLIAEQLNDSATKVRLAALNALIAIGEPDAIEPLRIAIDRGPPDVRSAALVRLVLRRQTTAGAGRQLLGAALDDAEFEVRKTAFWVAVLGRPPLARRLARLNATIERTLAQLDPDGQLIAMASGAPTEADLEPLFTALACRYPDTALRSARCLALLQDGRATGALLQLSREQQPELRRQVATAMQTAAIAMPGDERLHNRLQWLLNDADAGVRAAALDALLELAAPDGPSGQLALAEAALLSNAADIRQRALQILVHHGVTPQPTLAQTADTLLGNALDDEDATVRGEAFRTLWAWHSKRPETTLRRAIACAHGDIRGQAVAELTRQKRAWAKELLLERVTDHDPEVGLAAYRALTPTDKDKQRPQVHLAAMQSPARQVQIAGVKGARACNDGKALRTRLIELLQGEDLALSIAVIETIDKLLPGDAQAFTLAFASLFYELRVRAGELCGKRRDQRATDPLIRLLSITKSDPERPSDALRQRAARALADTGDPSALAFFVALLEDEDSTVQEMAARGLATTCRSGQEQMLADALSHANLAVRSWASDGLARLGDSRAIPVLAGTQQHEHLPIRKGALISFVALGSAGVQGILQGLDDPERDLQDLVFAVVVARDIALARAGQPPDLLLSALSSAQTEIRYAAARTLEARIGKEDLTNPALELIGPRKPERAADMKDWPPESERVQRLNVLINALASASSEQRYAAAQVLDLRAQPVAFWREAGRLASADQASIPHTNWDEEAPLARKTGWLRGLFGRARTPATSPTQRLLTVLRFGGGGRPAPPTRSHLDEAELWRLVFGAYTGLVRQAPIDKGADDYQRVRRDSIERLRGLASVPVVGTAAVLPILRQALNDPHHLVRRAALLALRTLYPAQSLEPLTLALGAEAADVGRSALDELMGLAQAGNEAALHEAQTALDAPAAEVRRYALDRLPRLFEAGSLEPWLAALASRYPDVRLAVVDRLADATDPRVGAALNRALESDHEDLRLKAAVTLANRGESRALDVLAAFLHGEQKRNAQRALEALVALAHARPDDAGTVAITLAARLENDPDRTADRSALIAAISRSNHPDGAPALQRLLLAEDEAALHDKALRALCALLIDPQSDPLLLPDGRRRRRYREALALAQLAPLTDHPQTSIRRQIIQVLGDIDEAQAEALLVQRLEEDRDPDLRALAAATIGRRVADQVPGASTEPLRAALRSDQREVMFAAATGLADAGHHEAFQNLVLVLKAGETDEQRRRAVIALGHLGDRRALEYLEPLLDPQPDTPTDDRALAPFAAEALGLLLPRLEREEERGRVRETLSRLTREASGALRRHTLSALRHAGDERSRSLLEGIAGDRFEDLNSRRHAVAELGRLGQTQAEPLLAQLLDEADTGLRDDALKALKQLFPEQSTRINLLALASKHTAISQPAAAFLARRGDPEMLIERLDAIDDGRIRQRLRQGLIRRGDCPVAALEKLLAGARPAPRAEAAWITGHSGEQALKAAVVGAVGLAADGWRRAYQQRSGATDFSHSLREEANAWRAALWAAGQLQAELGTAARAALQDPLHPAAVRQEAARIVAKQGGQEDAELLQAALLDAHAGVRAAAAAALAELAGDQIDRYLDQLTAIDSAALAAPLQTTASASKANWLATAAGRQLALPIYLAQGRTTELIASASAPGKDPARLSAIATLGRIGGAEARSALEGILADKSEQDVVRATAFKALRRLQRAARASQQETATG